MNGFFVIEKLGETVSGFPILKCHEQYLETYSMKEATAVMRKKYSNHPNKKAFFVGRWYTDGNNYFRFYDSISDFCTKHPSAVVVRKKN